MTQCTLRAKYFVTQLYVLKVTCISICQQQDPLYAYKSTADPDTMYHHETMKEHNKHKFTEVMQKEYDNCLSKKINTLVHKSKVPKDATILPDV